MKWVCISALGLAGLVVTGCHAISEGDAQKAVVFAENATKTDDVEKRAEIYYVGCGALESCAAGCSSALSATVDPSQRAMLIARCFDDFPKAKAADPKLTAAAWFAGYFDRYLVRAREKLPGADQARLDAARKKLGFSK